MPSVSFLGHMCGILIGFAHKKGVSSLLLSPPRSWLLRLEKSACGSRAIAWMGSRYVPLPSTNPIQHEHWPWVVRLNAKLCGASSQLTDEASRTSQIANGVHRGGSGAWASSASRTPREGIMPNGSSSASSSQDRVAIEIDERRSSLSPRNGGSPAVDGGIRGKKKSLVGTFLANFRGAQQGAGGVQYTRLSAEDDLIQPSQSSQDTTAHLNPVSLQLPSDNHKNAINANQKGSSKSSTNLGGKSRLLASIPRATAKGKEIFVKSKTRHQQKEIASLVNQKMKHTLSNAQLHAQDEQKTHQQQEDA